MSDETRYGAVTQALALAARLAREPWQTRAELAAAMGVHERTILRMIDALRAAGLEVEQRERKGTVPRAAHEYRVTRAAWLAVIRG